MNNSTSESSGDFFAEGLYHPANILVLVIHMIINEGIGRILSLVMVKHVLDSPMVILSERIFGLGFVPFIMSSVVNVVNMLTRLIVGPLPDIYCTATVILFEFFEFFIVLSLNWFMLSRLLMGYVWKNVGYLNEEFILFSIFLINTILGLYVGAIILFLGAYKNPIYIVCRGHNPADYHDIFIPHKIILHIATVTFSSIVNFLLYRERHLLARIHSTGRFSSGLPRVGKHHPGVKFLRTSIIAATLLFIGQLPFALFNKYFWDGTINTFPKCLNMTAMVFIPGLIWNVILPVFAMRNDESLERCAKRTLLPMIPFLKY